ncbi:MAG TPA: hypothetical protein VIM10_11690 [Actinopolymorphaceae bacterium]
MPDTKVDPEPTPTPTATPTGTPTGARDAEIAPYVGLPWRAGLLLSISLWCYLAMSELSRLSGDRLDTNDRSRPFVQLLGPSWFLTSGTPSTSADARCIAALPNSTAGMATSRFPYVTPSGGVGPCRGRSGQQLVDGGYTENSGIGTIVDLSSSWLAAVRSVNNAAARTLARPSAGAGASPEVIVPIVVYLVDDGGRDVAGPATAPTSEALVPIIANSRAGKMQESPQSLLQRAAALTTGTQLCDPSINRLRCSDYGSDDVGADLLALLTVK